MSDLQVEVRTLGEQRGTVSETITQKALILTEEVFEVLKIATLQGTHRDRHIEVDDLADELADVLFVCYAVCNRTGLNLAEAWSRQDVIPGALRENDTLDTAHIISESTLDFVRYCRQLDSRDRTSDSRTEDLSNILGGIASSVERVARLQQIDLEYAIDHKLRKDQLRLWI